MQLNLGESEATVFSKKEPVQFLEDLLLEMV